MTDKEKQAEEIVKTITKKINDHSKEIRGWDKAFQIEFTDAKVVYWVKISAGGNVEKVEKSTKKKAAEATISSTTDTLQNVLDGSTSPILAMMSGQIKLEGKIETMMKLAAVFA